MHQQHITGQSWRRLDLLGVVKDDVVVILFQLVPIYLIGHQEGFIDTDRIKCTVARYRQLYPAVRIFLREAHSPASWDSLRRGELDLAFVTGGSVPTGESWFVAEPCLDDTLVVAAAPGDPAPDAWVGFPRGSMLRRILDEHFDAPDVVMELGSIAAVKGNVRAGIGRCLISRQAITQDVAEGRLVEVEDPRSPIQRTLVVVHRGVDRLPPAAARLRELLLDA